MIAIGNTKKMMMGGWVLAALMVVAYNGSQLASLLAPPVAGYSPEVKSIISKRHQLDAQVSAARQSMKQIDLTGITAGVDQLPEKKENAGTEPPQSSAPTTDAAVTEKETLLPQLQGIFRVSDIHGNVKLRALLEGKILREKDQIGIFTVERISDKGIVLTKDERSWFLQTPDVPFCFAREE
jgi:hypothetical protein